jgi:hypothetical protein
VQATGFWLFILAGSIPLVRYLIGSALRNRGIKKQQVAKPG